MGVQIQGIVFDASRLSQMLRDNADQLNQINSLLIFVLMAALTAFLLSDYLLIYRRTLKSLSNLQVGTRNIGSGNLEYFIEAKKADEFGELAHAFNQMTSSLKTVTASKADLENEIIKAQAVRGGAAEE
ncbi:MAG: HAMP domain-containing protein [Bacillota bacterium]